MEEEVYAITDYVLSYYNNKRMNKVIHQLTTSLSEFTNSDEKRGKVNKLKREEAVKCFVCNTIKAINKGHKVVHIPLRESRYSEIVNGVKSSKVSYTYTRCLLDMLLLEGFIDLSIGGVSEWGVDYTGDFSVVSVDTSKYYIGSKLEELLTPILKHENETWTYDNVLHLRGSNKKNIAFKVNNKTRSIIAKINATNKVMKKAKFTYKGQRLDDVQYRRIFNRSFESGGRYYTNKGVIQTMKQTERLQLQIDGDPVVELDYSAHHPRMLYTMCDILMPEGFDPYCVDWGEGYDKKEVRTYVKRALLIMINAESLKQASQAIGDMKRRDKKIEDIGGMALYKSIPESEGGVKKAKLLIKKLSDHNLPIASFFNTGCGLELQYADSTMSAYILDHFVDIDEACVAIHDSYIVKESLKDELERVMKKAYEEVLESSDNCVVEVK